MHGKQQGNHETHPEIMAGWKFLRVLRCQKINAIHSNGIAD